MNKFLVKTIRGIAYNYREGGLKTIGFKMLKTLYRKIYDRQEMLILESDFREISSPKLQLEVRTLSFRELQDFGYFKILSFPEVILERFKNDQKCFGFFLGKKLAHIVWVTHGYLEITKQFPIIKIQSGTGIYDVFTVPEFRRRGIYSSALIYLQKILQQQGESKALVAVAPGNIYSQKGLRRAGFRYLYLLHYRRIFFFFSSVWKSKMSNID